MFNRMFKIFSREVDLTKIPRYTLSKIRHDNGKAVAVTLSGIFIAYIVIAIIFAITFLTFIVKRDIRLRAKRRSEEAEQAEWEKRHALRVKPIRSQYTYTTYEPIKEQTKSDDNPAWTQGTTLDAPTETREKRARLKLKEDTTETIRRKLEEKQLSRRKTSELKTISAGEGKSLASEDKAPAVNLTRSVSLSSATTKTIPRTSSPTESIAPKLARSDVESKKPMTSSKPLCIERHPHRMEIACNTLKDNAVKLLSLKLNDDPLKMLSFLYYFHRYNLASLVLSGNDQDIRLRSINLRNQIVHTAEQIGINLETISTTQEYMKKFVPNEVARLIQRTKQIKLPDEFFAELIALSGIPLNTITLVGMPETPLYQLFNYKIESVEESIRLRKEMDNEDFSIWLKTCIIPLIHTLATNPSDQSFAAVKMTLLIFGEYCDEQRIKKVLRTKACLHAEGPAIKAFMRLAHELRTDLAHEIDLGAEIDSKIMKLFELASSFTFPPTAPQTLLDQILYPPKRTTVAAPSQTLFPPAPATSKLNPEAPEFVYTGVLPRTERERAECRSK